MIRMPSFIKRLFGKKDAFVRPAEAKGHARMGMKVIRGVRPADEPIIALEVTDIEPEYRSRVRMIRDVAAQSGWREVFHRPQELRLRYKKGKNDLIDVWYSKMTVATIIDHPTKPRRPLFRKMVDKDLLRKIFEKPRTHTGEGYY